MKSFTKALFLGLSLTPGFAEAQESPKGGHESVGLVFDMTAEVYRDLSWVTDQFSEGNFLSSPRVPLTWGLGIQNDSFPFEMSPNFLVTAGFGLQYGTELTASHEWLGVQAEHRAGYWLGFSLSPRLGPVHLGSGFRFAEDFYSTLAGTRESQKVFSDPDRRRIFFDSSVIQVFLDWRLGRDFRIEVPFSVAGAYEQTQWGVGLRLQAVAAQF